MSVHWERAREKAGKKEGGEENHIRSHGKRSRGEDFKVKGQKGEIYT